MLLALPQRSDQPSGTHGGMVTDGYCSGEFPYNVMIVDTLAIPVAIPVGEYVLGFRWDCERAVVDLLSPTAC